MQYDRPLECCGIAELSNISGNSPETLVRYVAESMREEWEELRDEAKTMRREYGENSAMDIGEANYQAPFIIFSGINSMQSAKGLADYIKKENLGSCINTKARVNPRSGNQLKVWVWTPKKRELKKWLDKNK